MVPSRHSARGWPASAAACRASMVSSKGAALAGSEALASDSAASAAVSGTIERAGAGMPTGSAASILLATEGIGSGGIGACTPADPAPSPAGALNVDRRHRLGEETELEEETTLFRPRKPGAGQNQHRCQRKQLHFHEDIRCPHSTPSHPSRRDWSARRSVPARRSGHISKWRRSRRPFHAASSPSGVFPTLRR